MKLKYFVATVIALLLAATPLSSSAYLLQRTGSYPSYVNFGGTAGVTGGTSFTIPLPASRTVGNVMVAVTTVASSRTPTWPGGWTPIGAAFAAYRIVDGTESSGPLVTWTGASNQGGQIFQWTGTVNGGVGATNDNQAQTGTTASVSSVNTTSNWSLCAALVVSGVFTVNPTVPAGYTNRAANPLVIDGSVRVADVQELSTGTACPAVSSTVSNSTWRALLVELKSQ